MPVDISSFVSRRASRPRGSRGPRSRRALGAALLIAAVSTAAACTPNVSGGQPAYPPMPTSGRYSTAQFTDGQLTKIAKLSYCSEVV
jgi:hypothetical protein